MIIPKCTKCKTDKNVVFRTADVKEDKSWWHLCYCTKCYTVMECHVLGMILDEKEQHKK